MYAVCSIKKKARGKEEMTTDDEKIKSSNLKFEN